MGEAYLPVLEALGRLGRQPGGESVVALLARQAPTWLVQMPSLVDPAGLERLREAALGATRERMLREMVEALEALSHDQPLVLLLEDLHWSDPSTLDLLAWLARRREPARLLIIGTFRPAEARLLQHPLDALSRELRLRGLAQELPLPYLSPDEIETFLTRRFPGATLPPDLAQQVGQRTDGNPLFLVNVVDSWVARALLTPDGTGWRCQAGLEALTGSVPDDLRALIEEQVGRLSQEDQEVLESAAVAGMEFSAALAAAGLDASDEAVESRCAGLARRGQLLRAVGPAEWPDGTIAGQFGFTHHLYQQVLYERVPAGRQVRLHRQIGARLESAYGSQAGLVAPELIVHFARARDSRQTVRYQQVAAHQALQRSAHREAIEYARAGLEAIKGWAETTERAQQELQLQAVLGPAFIATQGWGSPEAEQAYRRARELCLQLPAAPLRSQVLFGLAALHEWRGEYDRSQAIIEQRFQGQAPLQDPDCLLESYDLLACSLFHQGRFAQSLQQADQGLSRYDAASHSALVAAFGEDPGVQCHGWAAQSLWFLGQPNQALERARTALPLAQEHPYSLASAQLRLASVHQFRREPDEARLWAEAAIALATRQGFPYQVAVGTILRGWALAVLGRAAEGIDLISSGLDACRATGALLDDSYFLALLAEACGLAGRAEEALCHVADGLAQVPRGRSSFYEAELHRLTSLLRLQAGLRNGPTEAEASLLRALDAARQQQARSLELRAAVSLARLWRHQGRGPEARQLLAEACAACPDGLLTVDGREAGALVETLERERTAAGRA
jgi:predicted ATPase